MKKKYIIIGLILLLAIVVALPSLINYLIRQDLHSSLDVFKVTLLYYLIPMSVVFLLNYYLLEPYLYHKRRRLLFWIANVVIIVLLNNGMLTFDPTTLPTVVQEGFYSYLVILVLINFIMVICALITRRIIRLDKIQRSLMEEKQKNTEAELVWLKNQLNPHFLFNTLNNISSLTYIDADEAQEKIAQLSDVLRYALYQSNEKKVPLAGEIEFMRSYIELMRMRCDENTTVEIDISPMPPHLIIAPLLFISPIENAFKHGVSTTKKSFIHVSLREDEGHIFFVCENTNIPKSDNNHTGSGIGLENLRRRLELIYPDRYIYKQYVEDDVYHVNITLEDEKDNLPDH